MAIRFNGIKAWKKHLGSLISTAFFIKGEGKFVESYHYFFGQKNFILIREKSGNFETGYLQQPR